MNELETLEYLRVSVFNLPFSFSECVCVCVCAWVCECVCPNNTDLVEAALGNGLQQLIGFLRFMPGNNTCRLCGQGLATHQHHNIYCFLEEHYLSVFILERKKKKVLWWKGECTGERRDRMWLWKPQWELFSNTVPLRWVCWVQHKLFLMCYSPLCTETQV